MNQLTKFESQVIEHKVTEPPFTGEYDDFYANGVFICRKCNNPLFDANAKFNAGCGWPAFDSCYVDHVREIIDADGRRTEIICANCGGHLGHVFRGENFTQKDIRHCVNSASIKFVPQNQTLPEVFLLNNGNNF